MKSMVYTYQIAYIYLYDFVHQYKNISTMLFILNGFEVNEIILIWFS